MGFTDMKATLEYIVKKFNIGINQKSPIEIPDLSRDEFARLLAELGFNLGVEVGVLEGKYSKVLCDANPNLKLFGIDPWESYPEYTKANPQSDFDYVYEVAKKTVPSNCTLIKKKSMDAVKEFDDNSIDFVYVDGNHEFTSEANDIHEWSKKVKVGGIVSGHDYRHYPPQSYSHSYEVVNAYTAAYRIRPWFIIGRNKNRVRSWFWIKS